MSSWQLNFFSSGTYSWQFRFLVFLGSYCFGCIFQQRITSFFRHWFSQFFFSWICSVFCTHYASRVACIRRKLQISTGHRRVCWIFTNIKNIQCNTSSTTEGLCLSWFIVILHSSLRDKNTVSLLRDVILSCVLIFIQISNNWFAMFSKGISFLFVSSWHWSYHLHQSRHGNRKILV